MFGNFEEQFKQVFGETKGKDKAPVKEPDSDKR